MDIVLFQQEGPNFWQRRQGRNRRPDDYGASVLKEQRVRRSEVRQEDRPQAPTSSSESPQPSQSGSAARTFHIQTTVGLQRVYLREQDLDHDLKLEMPKLEISAMIKIRPGVH